MDDRVEDMDLVTARRSSQMSTSRRESGTESPANILLLKRDLVTNKDNDKKSGKTNYKLFMRWGMEPTRDLLFHERNESSFARGFCGRFEKCKLLKF